MGTGYSIGKWTSNSHILLFLSDNLSIHWVSELAEHTRIHSTSGRIEIQTGPDERRRGFGQNLREFLEGRRDVASGIHKLFMRRRLLDNVDLLRFLHQAKIRCIGSPVRCGTNFSFRSVHGRWSPDSSETLSIQPMSSIRSVFGTIWPKWIHLSKRPSNLHPSHSHLNQSGFWGMSSVIPCRKQLQPCSMVYLSFAILFLVTAVLDLQFLLMYNGVSLHYNLLPRLALRYQKKKKV